MDREEQAQAVRVDLRSVAETTDRLLVRSARPSDAPRMADYYRRNAAHLAPWEANPRPAGFYTTAWWQQRLLAGDREAREGRALRLVLEAREPALLPLVPPGSILGCVNFTQIVRGCFQAAILGYSIDGEAEGRGLMSEGLRAALAHAFGPMNLHRVMANYQPHNVRSAHLLAGLGFQEEGYAPDYLYLGGTWRDHLLAALHNPAWKAPGS